MSADANRDVLFDHVAKADGQVVHCERAAFVAVGLPSPWGERFQLGFWLGAGAVGGGTCMVGVISLVSKVMKAVFA